MKSYFQKMVPLGKPLSERQLTATEENARKLKEVEDDIARAVAKVRAAGIPAAELHRRGQFTAMERIEKVADPGTFLPLNTVYDPFSNPEGCVGVIQGLGKISGRYASIIASDNKVLAGAWIAGQSEIVFRAQDLAERLRIPLVWILNCSGVKLMEQEKVYAGRRSGGRTFFRHAELLQKGVPVIVGIFGTNPAGGGYHSISPAFLIAHKDANMAVGGGGIVSGMSPKGGFDLEGAQTIIEATRRFKEVPPGKVSIHRDETGFFREVYDTEDGVLEAIRRAMAGMPFYAPELFRIADPVEPKFSPEEINRVVPANQKMTYEIEQVLARLLDGSEHLPFRPEYGPEIYCGLAKVGGFLAGVIANRQGFLAKGYPKYAGGKYLGVGGKLYREGLIKMIDFVSLCGRDRIPILWLQDTTGIDVGDIAEKAELLGLGQSLIYSIESSDVPMMCVILRKGTAAAHYIMGGPQANRNNAFTLGTPSTEIYVMHGETAAVAAYARRLVKEKDSGKPLEPVIEKMNALAKQYHEQSRPLYCARAGFVDEIVSFPALRNYLCAFTQAAYQNPASICPPHQMLLPRLIRG
ncbi:MAG: glutaconyl-CoA decarboxylase subunit alpha [Deltaproteobacteria bacterium]|nr:glutaconyl-CoA decarboxylase subunit alpha [Deltaproteobacteria bacterium]